MSTERICVDHAQQVFYWQQLEVVNILFGLWGKKYWTGALYI